MSVGKIAAGVFIGSTLFALLAWFIAYNVMEAARSNEAIADVEASAERVEARRIETCARYKAAVSEKDRDPTSSTHCPD